MKLFPILRRNVSAWLEEQQRHWQVQREAQLEARLARYQEIADELELQADISGRFHGTFGPVQVLRSTRTQGDKVKHHYTVTRFHFSTPLPAYLQVRPTSLLDRLSSADLEIGQPWDDKVFVKLESGHEDSARRLLGDPAVASGVGGLLASGISWWVKGRTLRTSFSGHHHRTGPRGLRLGIELAQAIDRVNTDPWRGLARDLQSAFDPDEPVLAGVLDGIPLRIRVRREKTRLATWVVGWFDPTLPPDTVVDHRDRRPRSQPIGDAFLDQLVAATTSDPEGLRHRLAREAVRPPLLELLHRFPGSSVRHDRVMLRLTGFAGPCLEDHAARVVELCKALSAP